MHKKLNNQKLLFIDGGGISRVTKADIRRLKEDSENTATAGICLVDYFALRNLIKFYERQKGYVRYKGYSGYCVEQEMKNEGLKLPTLVELNKRR